MSDKKDRLTETFGSLLSKAKEFAASDTVTGAVNSAVNTVKQAAADSGVTGIYEKGAERARSFGAATRLTMEIGNDRKELERIYAEIGRLYYEQAQDAPTGFFAPLFEQAASLQVSIAGKEQEVERYRAAFESRESKSDNLPQEEILDFEDIVNRTEDHGRS